MGKAGGFLKLIGVVNKHPVVALVSNVGTALEVGKAAIDVAGSDTVKGFIGGAFGSAKKFLGISVAGASAADPAPPVEPTPIADVGARPAAGAARPGPKPAAPGPSCRDLLSKQATAIRQQYQAQLNQALAGQGQMPQFDPSLYEQFGMPDGSQGYYDPSMYQGAPSSYYGMPGVYGVSGAPIVAPAPPVVIGAIDPTCSPCQIAARRGATVAGAGMAIVIGATAPEWYPEGETIDTGRWVPGAWIEEDGGGARFVPDPNQ